MKNISLDGTWKLCYFPQGKYNIDNPEQLKASKALSATVPGNVEFDLINAGELPEDLFYADNINKLKPYEIYEWWYEREFTIHEEFQDKEIELVFHGVDCLATYWLNGEPLGTSQNMLIEHYFGVSGKLKFKERNVLIIRLKSPICEAMSKRYDPLLNFSRGTSNVEQTWIRKAAHGYGWDIMPRALSAGLWRSVELVIHDENEITDIYFHTQAINFGTAAIQAYYELNIKPEYLSDLKIKISGKCNDSSFETTNRVTFKAGTVFFDINNPELWWPKGYGTANLYQTVIQLIHKDTVIAERQAVSGVRTVELVRTEITGPENVGQFLFKVNGTPILCKGSNWVPADVFHSRDIDRYPRILELFDDSGCNIIRCWGGDVYEDNDFFDICDKLGFMVWQDFAMACALYPQTPEFLELIREEAFFIVRKLRNHPSIVVWSGDNECDLYASYLRGFDPNQNKITREVLPGVVYQCDPFRSYLPSSPYISPAVAVKKDFRLMPEDHLWGPRDYYKSRFYTESTAHFISEIGYHGCPNLSSIRRFIDKEHLWPWHDNMQWTIHSTNHTGDQGRIRLMADQIKEMFGMEPDNIDDFILTSQISQAEAKKFFIEMVRLKKWRRTGIIWWNMMDGWPQFSDAVVDYYFGKKLAYHYIKRVQQPFCIMIDEPENWYVKVIAGNDSLVNVEGSYRVWDADTGITLIQGDFLAKANENTALGKIRVSHSDKKLLLIEWKISGERYGNHYLLGLPPFSLDTYKIWLNQISDLNFKFDTDIIGK